MLVGAILFVILLIIGSALLVLWPKIHKMYEEKMFKYNSSNIVYQIAMDKDFYVINNVAIEIDTKIIHFSHIIFGNKYIYCIGDLYQNGPLSGKFKDIQWMKYLDNGEIAHIKNPLSLHRTRVQYLKSALNAEDLLIGISLVNDECLIDKVEDAPEDIFMINLRNLKSFINNKEKENVSPIEPIQLDSLVRQIYNKNNQTKEYLEKQDNY